mgnify:FL=1
MKNQLSNSAYIRIADKDDALIIEQLANQIWPITYEAIISKEQINYMLNLMYNQQTLVEQMQLGCEFLLIYLEDKPAGFAAWTSNTENKIAKLEKIYVLPKQHKKGLGQLLLDEIIEKCKEKGIAKLKLNVNRENNAKLFYEKNDFEIIETVDISLDKFWLNDFIMMKNL